MSEYQPANLENLFVKRAGKRMRVASCDPTGGNNDNVLIPSGETYLFADLQGPGIVTHFFCTIGNPNKRRPECGIGTEEFNVRKVVLNVYWDDETEPSIQAPLGDFFGMGHGITKSFASAPLQITPEDGRGFNCWFPMPFRRRARFTVKNECCSRCTSISMWITSRSIPCRKTRCTSMRSGTANARRTASPPRRAPAIWNGSWAASRTSTSPQRATTSCWTPRAAASMSAVTSTSIIWKTAVSGTGSGRVTMPS